MRKEFSAKTKELAAQRAAGRCEVCTRSLRTGDSFYCEFDHQLPCGLLGDNSASNCVVLCKSCHLAKTRTDIKAISKAKRNYRKAHGIKKPRRITRWRRFDGTIVTAPRER